MFSGSSVKGATTSREGRIQTASIVDNRSLCREHYRLTLHSQTLPRALPGQFIHIGPQTASDGAYRSLQLADCAGHDEWIAGLRSPTLRRAFSISGLRRTPGGVEVDVMYRVVGVATRWMESLSAGDRITVLGPLGNGFPISQQKPVAWLVAGGVGLPPMLWLAEALRSAGRAPVAFCGAQTADLLALSVDPGTPPARDAGRATPSAIEFAQSNVPAVISTDDGSLGFHGYVGQALAAYHDANPTAADDVVVYTCGPEPMMRFVAEYCLTHDIECYACMERAMACGTGMCQSCVVPVRSEMASEAWEYKLCCVDGPVFDVRTIIWEQPP